MENECRVIPGYEGRTELVPVSRYLVQLPSPDGTIRELFSRKSLLKQYQLYRSPATSIPGLVEYARTQYPDHQFVVLDSYSEVRHRIQRKGRPSRRMVIRAVSNQTTIDFMSLTSCANHFGVDRSSILNRINNQKTLDGWSFVA